MREHLTDASEELKRVDHLIYVSLKYTRAVDVIRNVIGRIISALECMMEAHLIDAEENNDIDAIPALAIEKCQLLKSTYADNPQLTAMLDFYLLLRKIMRAEYSASKEFRRHVTMTVQLEGEDLPREITIDVVHEYYDRLREYFDHSFAALQSHEEKKEAKKK